MKDTSIIPLQIMADIALALGDLIKVLLGLVFYRVTQEDSDFFYYGGLGLENQNEPLL